MVEARHHDLVAGANCAGEGTAEMKGQACHIVAKDNFARLCVQEIGDSLTRTVDGGIGANAGFKGAMRVGVATGEIIDHSVDHALWDLCAAGVDKKDGGSPIVRFLQGGELAADVGCVK